MSTLVDCPSCQRRLRVPDDLLGKQVKCPGCQEMFTAEAGATPSAKGEEGGSTAFQAAGAMSPRYSGAAEEEGVSDKPLPRPARDQEDEPDDDEGPEEAIPPANWWRVRGGFSLLLASVLTYVGGFLLYMAGAMCLGVRMAAAQAKAGAPGGPPNVAVGGGGPMMSGIIVLVVVLLLTLLAGYVLGVVGHVLCLASPRVYGARTLAVVNLVLVAVHLGLTILGYALSAVGGGGVVGIMGGMGNPMFGGMDGADGASKWLATTNLVLGPVNNVLTFVGLFVFGLYVRAIGRCLRDSALAKSAKGWLIALSIVGVIGLVTAVGVMVEFKDLFANMANPQAAGPGAGGPPAAPLPGMLAVAGLSCVFGLVALILLIWYTIMLVQARNAISYRAGKP